MLSISRDLGNRLGRANALNNTPATGDYSVGLWQINYYGSLLASRTAEFGTPASLQGNANAQAKAAIKLSDNGTNLGPWQSDPVVKAINAGEQIPTQYTNGQSVSAATTGAAAAAATDTATQCKAVIGEGGILGIGSATLLNSCQAAEIVGALLMGVGAGMLIVGITLVVADKAAPAVIGALIPATRAAKSTGTAAKSVTKSTAKRTPSPRQRENALPTRKAGESGEDYSARLKAS